MHSARGCNFNLKRFHLNENNPILTVSCGADLLCGDLAAQQVVRLGHQKIEIVPLSGYLCWEPKYRWNGKNPDGGISGEPFER